MKKYNNCRELESRQLEKDIENKTNKKNKNLK